MMKRLLILGAMLGSTTLPAYANHSNMRQATRASQELVQALMQTANESSSESMASRRRGQDLRADKFRNLSERARILASQTRREVLNPLRQRRNINVIRQNARQLQRGFQRFESAVSAILFMPVDIRYNIEDVNQWRQELRQALFGRGNNGPGYGPGPGYPGRPGHPGGPGYPGRPGYGNHKATCEVVLETLWGSDLERFYGRAVARNPQAAVAQAEREAMQQCSSRRSNLTMCTIDRRRCGLAQGF